MSGVIQYESSKPRQTWWLKPFERHAHWLEQQKSGGELERAISRARGRSWVTTYEPGSQFIFRWYWKRRSKQNKTLRVSFFCDYSTLDVCSGHAAWEPSLWSSRESVKLEFERMHAFIIRSSFCLSTVFSDRRFVWTSNKNAETIWKRYVKVVVMVEVWRVRPRHKTVIGERKKFADVDGLR